MQQQLLETSFHPKGCCKINNFFHSFLAEFLALSLHTNPNSGTDSVTNFIFKNIFAKLLFLSHQT
jgi:hypothetical protein